MERRNISAKGRFFPFRMVGVLILVAWMVGCLNLSSALAHKVNVYAYVEGGTVYVESYFPDGSPVSQAAVKVYDASEKVVVQGKTDKEGLFQFPLPADAGDLKIEVNASLGHKASYKLKKEEFGE